MSAPQSSRDSLLALIDRLCGDALTPDEAQRLESLLANDAAARRVYLEYFDLHTEMHWLTEMRRGVAPLPAPLTPAQSSTTITPAAPVIVATALDPRPGGFATVRDYLTRTSGFSLIFALVAVVSLLLTTAQVYLRDAPARVESPAAATRATVPVLARLAQTIDCQWADGEPAFAAGARLRQGATLDLRRGIAEVAFLDGTRVVLNGPARFHLVAPQRGRLRHGTLTALVAEATEEFFIDTPAASVVDLGTEFGVSVERAGETEVHVFAGAVLVRPANGAPPRALKVGEAARIAPTESLELTAPPYQPERFRRVADLPELALAAAHDGLKRGLIHQWTFNDLAAHDLVGQMRSELHGGATITQGQLVLDGVDDYLRAEPLAKELAEYTLAVWVAPSNFEQTHAGVLILDQPAEMVFDGLVFAETAPLVWINGSDFFHRTQQRPQYITPEPMLPGEMALLTIAYESSGTITLARNGRRYGRFDGDAIVNYGPANSQVLIGLRHSGHAEGRGTPLGEDAFFAGAIDEVRLYDRALDAAQIQILYNAGPVPWSVATPAQP